jgi:hypothetical protein
MDYFTKNILGILLGILIGASVFIFMLLIIYVKKGFVKLFYNIDSLIKKINTSLDLKNKIK